MKNPETTAASVLAEQNPTAYELIMAYLDLGGNEGTKADFLIVLQEQNSGFDDKENVVANFEELLDTALVQATQTIKEDSWEEHDTDRL